MTEEPRTPGYSTARLDEIATVDACFEARAGQTDQAIEHIRRAIEISPALAELAREDEDLASLHGQPGFDEILA